MKTSIALTILLAAAMAAPAPAEEATSQPATAAPKPTAQPVEKPAPSSTDAALAPLAEAIERAADPLAAIDAYARGYAIDPNSTVLHRAYLNRMLRAALPEMAYESARVLASADPGDALAWSVLAHKHVNRGQLSEAAADIVRAAAGLGDSAFGQKVAAEVLAQYDRLGEQPDWAAALRASLEQVRAALTAKPAFTAAYAAAATRLSSPATQAQAPAGATATPVGAPAHPAVQASSPELLESRLRGLAGDLDRQAQSLRHSMSGSRRSSYSPNRYDRPAYYHYGTYNLYPYGYYPYSVYPSGWRPLRSHGVHSGVRIHGSFSSGGSLQGTFSFGDGGFTGGAHAPRPGPGHK